MSMMKRHPAAMVRRLACVALAAAAVCTSAGRAEDDRIVDDAELAALEGGQQVHGMNDGRIVDVAAQFDANLNGILSAQGFAGHQVMVNGRAVFHVNGGQVINGWQVPAAGGGQPPPGNAATESPLIGALRALVAPQLAQVETLGRPNADQRRLLQLALDSDVRRVAEEIERTRQKFVGVQVNFAEPAGQQRWQQAMQDIQRCQQRLQAFARGTDGLFGKVQSSVLAGEQYARLEAELESRRAHRWKTLVSVALANWDQVVGLSPHQHDELERLLVAKRPAFRLVGLGTNLHGTTVDQQAQWLCGIALADVGEQAARTVVSDRQWAVLRRMSLQAKQMRTHLEQTGLLEPARR